MSDRLRRKGGQGLIEYCLIVSLIVLVVIVGLTLLGQGVLGLYTTASSLP